MDLIIENVRSFHGRHVLPLAPLTILTGENSTGKTTFLAACRLAWEGLRRPDEVDFNEEPFSLGAFHDIASRTNAHSATSFTLGLRVSSSTFDQRKLAPTFEDDIECTARFVPSEGVPALDEWSVSWGTYSVQRSSLQRSSAAGLRIKTPSGFAAFDTRSGLLNTSTMTSFLGILKHISEKNWPIEALGPIEGRVPPVPEIEAIERMMAAVEAASRFGPPFASAPIRSRPKRTHDPVMRKPTPEGDHVPMLLNRLYRSRERRPQVERLLRDLDAFGEAAGLFRGLSVKRMGGDEPHLPFQIRVGAQENLEFNLVDVGYGVNQILPVLVDAIENPARVLLIQQPEVHLHPRAQAQLGSFLASIAVERRGRPVIVETHSDYLVDRVRMEVRDRTSSLRATDVRILHFEKAQGVSKVTPIVIETDGNLGSVPADYRRFFLDEDRRLLDG